MNHHQMALKSIDRESLTNFILWKANVSFFFKQLSPLDRKNVKIFRSL